LAFVICSASWRFGCLLWRASFRSSLITLVIFDLILFEYLFNQIFVWILFHFPQEIRIILPGIYQKFKFINIFSNPFLNISRIRLKLVRVHHQPPLNIDHKHLACFFLYQTTYHVDGILFVVQIVVNLR